MKQWINMKRNIILLLVLLIMAAGTLGAVEKANAASVKLNKKSATLWVGDSLRLKVKNTHKKVKWSSDKKKIATVSSKGKVKAKKAGKTVIKAKVGKKKLKCRITVRKTQLSQTSIRMHVGEREPLKLKYPKKKVAWLSGDTRIAYADGNYVYARAVGKTVITAKCNGKKYTCSIIVEPSISETQDISEDGIYTSKDKLALYIHTYHKLPKNFITKDEAKALGWQGGSLLPYAPDKCIGGDRFNNYDGKLPGGSERIWRECDVNTLGASSRGAERVLFSNDGLIYYTPDHYKTFQQLY